MNAKYQLLLRERDFLIGKVAEVQKEHAEAMNRLRMVEHAHCVTELEVERRATMLFQKQSAECDDLRHALQVFDEINYSDEQRLAMAERDLRHALALLADEQAYVQRLRGELEGLVLDMQTEAQRYRNEFLRERAEMDGLQADVLSARFSTLMTKSNFERWTGCCIAEHFEKERFEQHLFTQAIDKLRALEEERGRLIRGFMKNSEMESVGHMAAMAAGAEASPALHAVVTDSVEPSFAERARRLADQRYGTEDMLIQRAAAAEDNDEFREASLRHHHSAARQRDASTDPAPTASTRTQATSTPHVAAAPVRRAVLSEAPPALTWHGRRVGVPAHHDF